jgi:transposase
MEKLHISDSESIILALQDEIRRSSDSRYYHRLHGILLVAHGMSGRDVARMLGDSPRTVAYWVRRFEEKGFAGLADTERPGRPRRLTEKQLDEIGSALRKTPSDLGLNFGLWDGKTLSAFIGQRWGVTLGVRQCQYLFRRLGFRLRKPRPLIAHSDEERRKRYKKTR